MKVGDVKLIVFCACSGGSYSYFIIYDNNNFPSPNGVEISHSGGALEGTTLFQFAAISPTKEKTNYMYSPYVGVSIHVAVSCSHQFVY